MLTKNGQILLEELTRAGALLTEEQLAAALRSAADRLAPVLGVKKAFFCISRLARSGHLQSPLLEDEGQPLGS